MDYRKISKGTRKDAYCLLRVDDRLDTLAGYKWFSTLDLKSGHSQVKVAQNIDRRLLFVYMQEGLFEFKVMCFLLYSAMCQLVTFQHLMDLMLVGLQ